MWVNGIATGLCSAGLAAALLCAPLPAAAQMPGPDLFDVPAGCTAFLTVQARECTVSHHWTCEGDPEGTHWRISLDQDGPYYLSYTDAEFRWLRGWSLRSDSTTVLVEPEDDPASLTELLETGSDTMVFSLLVEGQTGRFRRDYTGFDSLTGGEVTVDGRTLLVTEFTYQYGVDGGARRVEGNQFVHEGWRMFFGGVETVTEPDGTSFEYNNSPMEFAEPGEPGFLSTRPIYDCGDMMSGLPRAPKSMVEQIFRVHAQGAVPGPNGGTDNDEL